MRDGRQTTRVTYNIVQGKQMVATGDNRLDLVALPVAKVVGHGVADHFCKVELVVESGMVSDKLCKVKLAARAFGLGLLVEGKAEGLYGSDDMEGPRRACGTEVKGGKVLVAKKQTGVGVGSV